MSRMRLTDAGIRRLKPDAREYTVRDSQVSSLCVRVYPSGSRDFAFPSGSWKLSLGPTTLLTVGEARRQCMRLQSEGRKSQASGRRRKASCQSLTGRGSYLKDPAWERSAVPDCTRSNRNNTRGESGKNRPVHDGIVRDPTPRPATAMSGGFRCRRRGITASRPARLPICRERRLLLQPGCRRSHGRRRNGCVAVTGISAMQESRSARSRPQWPGNWPASSGPLPAKRLTDRMPAGLWAEAAQDRKGNGRPA